MKGESRKKEERLSDIKLNRDGSIILAGTSAEELGKENWNIVKLGDKQLDQLIEKQDIKIYPNPVSDYCYVEIGFDFKEAEIIVYDMGGRQLQTLKTKNKITKINTKSISEYCHHKNGYQQNGKSKSLKLKTQEISIFFNIFLKNIFTRPSVEVFKRSLQFLTGNLYHTPVYIRPIPR